MAVQRIARALARLENERFSSDVQCTMCVRGNRVCSAVILTAVIPYIVTATIAVVVFRKLIIVRETLLRRNNNATPRQR